MRRRLKKNMLTLKCIMPKNGQTHCKNLEAFAANAILGLYALKG